MVTTGAYELAADLLGVHADDPGDSEAVGEHAVKGRRIEILTTDPAKVTAAVHDIPGVAGTVAPSAWTAGGTSIVDAWTNSDASSTAGTTTAEAVRSAAEASGARVGGIPAQNADFITAVYGNAWWIALIIVAVTFLLLARALRSIVLPVKALVLNVISVAAAYGVTILIWQHGFGTHLLFSRTASGSITVWVPIAVVAALGDANWWVPRRGRSTPTSTHSTPDHAPRTSS